MSRIDEWFVPKFGSLRFRVFIGMLFLPYTGMCISFVIIGSMLADDIHWDRVAAIAIIYFLGLGISAHILDAIGSKTKPWDDVFSKKSMLMLAISSLIIAYAIGIYYILAYNLYGLAIIAILEGFFLLAYNLELFNARFHNNISFAFSWGSLPLLAGYFIQTNSISLLAIIASISAAIISYAEITISRRYKAIKRSKRKEQGDILLANRYESMLKSMSISTIIIGVVFVVLRV